MLGDHVGIYKIYTKEIIIKKQVFDYYKNLIRPKNLEAKSILIDEKSYKDLMIYSTRHDRNKSVTMFSRYYLELTGKTEEHERKKYLMVDDYVLPKVLVKIRKIIGIEIFDDK